MRARRNHHPTHPLARWVAYVIPPDVLLEVSDRRVQSVKALAGETRSGIDHLFTSLAENAAGLVVGVLLSGSSSDGAAGLRAIKGAAGITLGAGPADHPL